MGIIAILSSPSSFLENDEMKKIRSVISAGSGIFHYEVEKHGDIAEALDRFHQSDIDLVVILGDRALASAIFEYIIEYNMLRSDIPLAIMPTGDNIIVTQSMGAVQFIPHLALKKLLEDYRNKKDFLKNIIEYPLIKLEGVRGISHLYGLFFCAGEVVRHKKLFTGKVLTKGLLNIFKRRLNMGGLILSAYRHARGKKSLQDAIRINRNQRGAVVGYFFMVLITGLKKSFWNMSLGPMTRPNTAHFISIENTPEAILYTAKQILKGHYESINADVAGHVITDINHARIVLKTPFVLDGSYYQADKSGELYLSMTHCLKFIRLN